MSRAAVLLALLALAVAPAAPAAAQLGPNDLPAPLTTPPPPAAERDVDDGGLSAWQKLLIFGVAGAVLGAIGFFIVRDARRAAPVDAPRGLTSAPGSGGGARADATTPGSRRAREQRARRAKVRAARRQRKRNRSR